MQCTFTIELMTDAEPGSGLGGNVVNQFIPRDFRGAPVVLSSHIKGLMRASLQDVCSSLSWGDELVNHVFGVRHDREPGRISMLRVHHAVADKSSTKKIVARTAIDSASGVAKDTSLRTSESVSIGTKFAGSIESHAAAGSVEDLAWRLSLLSIRAIGSSRNRGCGSCVIKLDDEQRSAGELLRALAHKLELMGGFRPTEAAAGIAGNESSELSQNIVLLRLIFRATMPVCCPEVTDKTNVIATGFSIPASAVQGAVLTRLNQIDSNVASSLYAHPSFRAWPMQPCHLPLAHDQRLPDDLPISIRVSLTHKMAKFSKQDEPFSAKHFFDRSVDIEAYDWKSNPAGAPLKASDGVLLRYRDGTRRLWKAGAMPHVVTAHGVHSDPEKDGGRNLFTVDSMAPLVWQGLIAMPENAAQKLLESLSADSSVTFGKGRSVRGLGVLSAKAIDGVPNELQACHDPLNRTVLVAQSPLLLSDVPSDSAEQELKSLATQWAKQYGLPAPTEAWSNVGVLFGWNRHDTNSDGRLRASRVALPGSVIVFSEPLDNQKLQEALVAGIGLGGRERGFGAACVHPGKAEGVYPDGNASHELVPVRASENHLLRDATKIVLQICESESQLPTASQIRAVQQTVIKKGCDAAREYLKKQTERTSRIWFTWEPIHKQVDRLLSSPFDKEVAARALELLADLRLAQEGK
jgi:hypothetical protein